MRTQGNGRRICPTPSPTSPPAGSSLVTGFFNGQELKHLLEFLLVDNKAHPGESFPRVSGMRFRYDTTRPVFDVVTAIEIGDVDRGYRAIDISGKDAQLYSVTSPRYFAAIAMAIPKYTKGKLPLVAKKQGRSAAQVQNRSTGRPTRQYPGLAAASGHGG